MEDIPEKVDVCKNCGAKFYPDEEVGDAVMIHPDNGCRNGEPQVDVSVV